MTRRPVVGVLGQHVAMEAAAERGFGRRELNVYALATMEKAFAHGMLAFGVPTLRGLDAARCCDLLDALILMPATACEGSDGCTAPDPRPEAFELAVATEALQRRLPILAICRGIHLLNLALAYSAGDHVASRTAWGEQPLTSSRHELSISDRGLRELLGFRVMVTMPHGDGHLSLGPTLRTAATGPAGTIDAAIGVEGPVLAVQWHPERLQPSDPAGEGPFRWLKQQLARA
jgi:putative glutamine amidotransferase